MQCIRVFTSTLIKSPLKLNVRSMLSQQKVFLSASAETMQVPAPDGANKPVSAKITNIVTDISSLSLLEVSELSALLKKTLNLPDTAFVNPGAGFAQVNFIYFQKKKFKLNKK